eukprot:TRINITY_DN14558_c0_g1_i2.p2 TRINITY_DN14558_c0_g1~~TRINITY_DN14558_c0_g1_i2.p2  ORF type:complete len:211 (-),score=7.02 TRINITY_DN14558_c0_g1_i2:22-654(-)
MAKTNRYNRTLSDEQIQNLILIKKMKAEGLKESKVLNLDLRISKLHGEAVRRQVLNKLEKGKPSAMRPLRLSVFSFKNLQAKPRCARKSHSKLEAKGESVFHNQGRNLICNSPTEVHKAESEGFPSISKVRMSTQRVQTDKGENVLVLERKKLNIKHGRHKSKALLKLVFNECCTHNQLHETFTHIRLSLIHICRCRRYAVCRSRWSPYH